MRRAALPLLSLLILTILLLRPTAPEILRQTIAPGLEYTQEIVPAPDGPLVWNVLRVRLKTPGVRVQAALSRDVVLTDEAAKGRESVGALAARRGAIAAVNADFFPFTGDPLGLMIHDGELVSEAMPHRAALGITADGQVLMDNLLPVGTLYGPEGATIALDGINRPAAQDEIVALTPTFGAKAGVSAKATVVPLSGVNLPVRAGQEMTGLAGQAVGGDPNGLIPPEGVLLVGSGKGGEWLRAHVRPGDTLRFRFDLAANPLPPGPPRGNLLSRAGALRGRITRSAWADVTQAVGGGPWLVRDGRIVVDGVEEGFSTKSFVEARHPRTAAGVTADGDLLLVVVDGRQAHSRGVSLAEMADYLLRLGAVQALNLDGGGSSEMVVRGTYVNSPSDGEPRAVANALLVFADPASLPEATDRECDPVTLRAGEKVVLKMPGSAPGSSGAGDRPPSVLWGTVEGRGYVNQQGIFTSTHAGSGTVLARRGAERFRLPVLVQPGPPARLKAAFAPAPNNPPDRTMLTVRVTDAYGNPLPGQAVRIRAAGGMADRPDAVTDAEGHVVAEVVWDVETNRRAEIACGSLKPITLKAK